MVIQFVFCLVALKALISFDLVWRAGFVRNVSYLILSCLLICCIDQYHNHSHAVGHFNYVSLLCEIEEPAVYEVRSFVAISFCCQIINK